MNLQIIKAKHSDQTDKQRAPPYRIHVSPLLNRRGYEQLIFKNVCKCKAFCAVLRACCVDFVWS